MRVAPIAFVMIFGLAAALAAGWLLGRSATGGRLSRRRTSRVLPPPPRWPIGVPDPESTPAEKSVSDPFNFLNELKRREREVDARSTRGRPAAPRPDVIDAEFHEVTGRDARA
jgi:hypothetical protein